MTKINGVYRALFIRSCWLRISRNICRVLQISSSTQGFGRKTSNIVESILNDSKGRTLRNTTSERVRRISKSSSMAVLYPCCEGLDCRAGPRPSVRAAERICEPALVQRAESRLLHRGFVALRPCAQPGAFIDAATRVPGLVTAGFSAPAQSREACRPGLSARLVLGAVPGVRAPASSRGVALRRRGGRRPWRA